MSADAALIAAAPDGLSAAKEASEFLRSLGYDKPQGTSEGDSIRATLDTFIAKAEGKPE